MKRYYFICYSIKINTGDSNLYNSVIDYSPLKWIKNIDNKGVSYKYYTLVSYNEITEEEYIEMKDFAD